MEILKRQDAVFLILRSSIEDSEKNISDKKSSGGKKFLPANEFFDDRNEALTKKKCLPGSAFASFSLQRPWQG